MNTLDGFEQDFSIIYCSCGRIVNIDRRICAVKKHLGKQLECASCRNRRIARELEADSEETDLWAASY